MQGDEPQQGTKMQSNRPWQTITTQGDEPQQVAIV